MNKKLRKPIIIQDNRKFPDLDALYYINVYLNGGTDILDGFLKFNNSNARVFVWKPIESVFIYNSFELFKCFTFFDEIQIPSSLNKINVDFIKIRVDFMQSWFPFDPEASILLAIHSPKMIPEHDLFFKLEQNDVYQIYFSKLDDYRLNNYDNCLERGDIKKYEGSRNYCLDKCFNETIKFECFERFTMTRPHPLRTYQFLGWNKTTGRKCIDLENYKTFKENSRPCYKKCKEDCYQTHYFVNIEDKNLNKRDIIHSYDPIVLKLQSNSRPNIIIEHFLEMTFLSLFCNFGGLIGMYLGISLESVCCHIWESAKNMFLKFIWIKIKNNNQHTININQPIITIHNVVNCTGLSTRRIQQSNNHN